MEYTKEHLEAMESVREGADVRSYLLAKTLRKVEAANPEYIWIGELAGHYPDVMEKLPYFGCILTEKGRAFIAETKRRSKNGAESRAPCA